MGPDREFQTVNGVNDVNPVNPVAPDRRAGRRRAVAAALLLATFSVFLLPPTWRSGMDFNWRYNEALCVRSGTDPFDVCFRGVETERFCSVFHPERGKLPVNAYTPWEYTWMLPLTALPRNAAHSLFMVANLAALLAVALLARRRARRLGLDADGALCVAAAACFLGLALLRVLDVSNYGLLMAAALMVLASAPPGTARGEAAAALAFAALMVKPQIGVLFAVPLLSARRWKTVLAAAAWCAVSALPAAALCHGNPVTMTWRVMFSGTHSIRAAEAIGTGLLPSPLVARLAAFAPESVWLGVSAALGLAFCLYGSWRLRRHPDFAIRLLPAAVVSLLWMPGHFHDRVLMALPLAVFATMAFDRAADGGTRRRAAACLALFTAEFWLCLIGGIAAAILSDSPMALIRNPQARTVYDLALCAAGYLQVAAVVSSWYARMARTHFAK